MKQIFSTQKIYNLTGVMVQIRIKLFNKVVFKYSFKHNLNAI